MVRSISLCLAAAALSAAIFGSACSDDTAPAATPSGKGESCTRTADCKSGLLCIDGACATGPGSSEDGGATGAGGKTSTGDGGKTTTGAGGSAPTTPPPVLGAEGESCTRRADCDTGLACILQTCTKNGSSGPGTPDGGPAPSIPTLGQRGETCQSVRDCADGLTCFPRPGIAGGICDLEKYGLAPTGKVCGGECNTAKDCCELPPNVQIIDQTTSTNVIVKSCQDIVEELLGGDPTVCDVATPTAAHDVPCFYYKTFCSCAANTWTCDANACVYAAKCTKDGDVFKGCATRSRLGTPTAAPTCDTTTNKCQTVATGCDTAKDCETKPVFDDPSDTCEVDECTCIEKKCYRTCDSDLDCAAHYTCDGKKHVCTPAPGCSSDAACAAALNDVTAVCKDDRCVVPCANDHQCSGSGINSNGGPFTARVCGRDNTCEPLGCATDAECSTSTLHTFCITVPPLATGAVRSAVTD